MTIPRSHAAPAARKGSQAAHRLSHSFQRIEQTARTFTNWPAVLCRLGGGRRLSEAVTFRTRTGLVITCPNVPGARVPVYEIFAEDCYRLKELPPAFLEGPLRVVDIGAHVGAFACELARLASRSEIYCFEPSPVTADYLQRNLLANGLAARVHVTEAALAARVGEAKLVDNRGGSALNNLVMPGEGAVAGIPVQTTTIDAVMTDVGGAQLVKIDCEGAEYDLLFGSAPDSWSDVERVIVEYHPHAHHGWADLRNWFADAGLVTERIEPSSPDQGTAWLARSGAPPGNQ